jgi:leader peptidase (prepilin peptidase)/N-methyltransferase
VLLGASYFDYQRQILPDSLNVVLGALAVFSLLFLGVTGSLDAIIGCLGGAFLLLAVRAVFQKCRGVQGLGLGDVKFIAAGGLLVGATALPFVLLIASISGLFLAVTLNFAGNEINRETRIAFGPHLSLGLYLTWIFKATNML